jgi:hypothetical protein
MWLGDETSSYSGYLMLLEGIQGINDLCRFSVVPGQQLPVQRVLWIPAVIMSSGKLMRWGIDLGNFKHKQPKSFPNISGSDKKKWTKKRDSALFGCWNTTLFDAPRPHHPSPGCPKPARHFSKEGVSVTGVFDLLWPLTTWHLGRWWRPSPPDKEYVRPRGSFWVRTRISRIWFLFVWSNYKIIHVFQSMSWTEQTHNLWIRMKRQTRGMIKFKILVDTSRNPSFCPYQFWVSNPWVSWCFEQNHTTTDLVLQIPVQC